VINDIIFDNNSDVYATGTTTSTVYPTFGTSIFQSKNAGSNDVFLIKLTYEGFKNYSTYYGGPVTSKD